MLPGIKHFFTPAEKGHNTNQWLEAQTRVIHPKKKEYILNHEGEQLLERGGGDSSSRDVFRSRLEALLENMA